MPFTGALALAGITRNSMITEPPQGLRKLRVAGGDHSTFPGRDVLHRMEAENRHVRNRASRTLAIFRAQSMTRVFDHDEPVVTGNLLDRLQIGWMSRIRHGKNRARPGRHLLRDLRRIDVERVGANIGKDRRGALIQNAIRGRGERHRSGDGLVARRQSRGKGRAMQSGGARTETHRVRRTHASCEGFFKLGDLRTRRQPIRSQNIDHRLDVCLVDGLPPIRQQCLAHWRSAVDGEGWRTNRRRNHTGSFKLIRSKPICPGRFAYAGMRAGSGCSSAVRGETRSCSSRLLSQCSLLSLA